MRHRPHLRVMAEYGSSGIWRCRTVSTGIFRHGMVEHQALGLPSDLAAAFDSWIESYEVHNLDGTLDVQRFNALGHELAQRLKSFLGADAVVEFQGEAFDGGLLPAVLL